MTDRRRLGTVACLACTVLSLSAPSCTPDERTLAFGLGASASSGAGSQSAAGASDSGGSSGSSTEYQAAGAAGESGAVGSSAAGNGAANPGGGTSGRSAVGGAGPSSGGVAGNGGTLSGGATNGGTGSSGATSGSCNDSDHNGVDDCSESLVQNSRFDSNVSPWTSAQWNSSNAHTGGSSGSLLVLNDLPVVADVGFNLEAAEQCIQVAGEAIYQVAASVMIPAGQGDGFGGINLWVFANDGCKGTFVTGLSPVVTQTTNAWTQLSAEFKMPTAARSMIVRLAATRPFAQEKLQVLFDDVVVKQKLP